jgi:hypothetical protein
MTIVGVSVADLMWCVTSLQLCSTKDVFSDFSRGSTPQARTIDFHHDNCQLTQLLYMEPVVRHRGGGSTGFFLFLMALH